MRVPSPRVWVLSLTSTPEYGAPLTGFPIMLPWRLMILICGAIFSKAAFGSSCAIAATPSSDPAASIAYIFFIGVLLVGIADQPVGARAPVGRNNHIRLHVIRSHRDP